nr:hypothetical protein Iba_chr13dCG4420 [Ipomoea batatas]
METDGRKTDADSYCCCIDDASPFRMGRKPLPSSVATASSPLLPLLHHVTLLQPPLEYSASQPTRRRESRPLLPLLLPLAERKGECHHVVRHLAPHRLAIERSRCCRLHGVTERGVPPRPSAAKHRLVATMSLCSQRRGRGEHFRTTVPHYCRRGEKRRK